MALTTIFVTPMQAIHWAWIGFGLYWLVSAFGLKKTKRSESGLDRLGYSLPLFAAVALLAWPARHRAWLGFPFLPISAATEWFGAAVTIAGLFVAVWARRNLGTNWSAMVTVKEGHELIRSGPYQRIRHPIYTGILLGFFGTVIAIGRAGGVLALAIVWLSFWVKARREESFLAQEFGERFEAHRAQTGMFLPKLG